MMQVRENAVDGSSGFEVLDSTEQTFNDTMNADALIARYGDRIRYVRGWGWLAYDGTRWEKDAEADVIEFAAETMRALGKWAFDLPNSDTRKRLLAHANRSLDMRDLSNMVKRAESDRRVRAKVEDFDRDPMKFNCLNGTLDLATGTLQPHNSADYITHQSGVEYDASARSARWEEFVLWAAKGREDLYDYLQRALGYSLTGKTSEKAFFFCYGPSGDNGKNTLLEAVKYVMGSYGITVPIETIISKQGASGDVSRDNVALIGKRFIVASEPEEGQRFKMGRLKVLTGSDSMPAKALYKEAIDFVPVLKIWLSANNQPTVPENGDAAWQRIKTIPFDAKIAKDRINRKLGEDFREDASAILTWLVTGCWLWFTEDGLHAPDCMTEASEEYRGEQDHFAAFVSECCGPGGEVLAASLLTAYNRWAEHPARPEVDAVSARKLNSTAVQHGYTKRDVAAGVMLVGIHLK
jgi:putative DNA primase/helicase